MGPVFTALQGNWFYDLPPDLDWDFSLNVSFYCVESSSGFVSEVVKTFYIYQWNWYLGLTMCYMLLWCNSIVSEMQFI